jgi:hypothetical protein
MANPSWQDIRAQFLRGVAERPDFGAHWDAREQHWTFYGGSPEAEHLFKETARIAASLYGELHVARPLWFAWLELMRSQRRGFRRIQKEHRWGSARIKQTVLTEDGNIAHVFKEAADFCADLDLQIRMREPELSRPQVAFQETPPAPTTDLPELPSTFQTAFETARSKAELQYANRAALFPHHPQFAEIGLHLPILIHTVFFEFCIQARHASGAGRLTASQVRRAVDAAWPVICDFYVVREHGGGSAEQKSNYRALLWRTVADDPRWKEHLLEVLALGDRDSNAPKAVAHRSNSQQEPELTLSDSPEASLTGNAAIPEFDGKLETPPAAWNQIEISFLNERSVQISAGLAVSVRDFSELGMADKRSGKPTRAWVMLHALAAADGVLDRPPADSPNWKTVEKRMQELRHLLRKQFGIFTDPLPFVKGSGYRSEFRINLARSYQR